VYLALIALGVAGEMVGLDLILKASLKSYVKRAESLVAAASSATLQKNVVLN